MPRESVVSTEFPFPSYLTVEPPASGSLFATTWPSRLNVAVQVLSAASVTVLWLPWLSKPYRVAVVVPPLTDQIPVNVFAGRLTVGAPVYWSTSTVRPRGSVTVVCAVPPVGGITVVRSPL